MSSVISRGENIFIEYRHEDRNFDRLPELAAELVRLKIDVFVTVTTNAAQAARSVSKTIPHVFMGVTDPVTAESSIACLTGSELATNTSPEGFIEARFINELEAAGFFEEMNRQFSK